MKFLEIKSFVFATILGFIGTVSAQETYDVPKYKGHVNDFAGVLSQENLQAIESKLLHYEDSTSTQIAVVIEQELNGKDVNNRAIEFARGWGVGNKDKQNGVVLYLAINDRKYFTVTSQATQGKLTDGVVGQIQREFLIPNLRSGNYYAAVDQTTSAYMQALNGEFVAGKSNNSNPGWGTAVIIVLIILFILFFNNNQKGRGFRGGGAYWFPVGGWGGGSSGFGGSSGGSDWGGFGGGGGFDGGGAGGSW